MVEFIGGIIGLVIGSALSALFGAFLLQFATKAIAKFRPRYSNAYFASFIGGLSTQGLGLIIGFAVAASGSAISPLGYGILMIIGFVLFPWILGIILKHPETGAIGFKKGALISLLYMGVLTGMVLVCVVLYGLIK